MATSTSVITPNLGLYLGRSTLGIPSRALQDGNNFRVLKGKLSNLNMGWSRFSDFTLDGPVLLIEDIFLRNGDEHLLFATDKSIYIYDANNDEVMFLSPRYETGTAAASGTAVSGTTTLWNANAKAGDFIAFGADGITDPAATWYEIDHVTNDTALVLTSTAGTVVNGDYTIRKTFTGDSLDVWVTDMFYNAGGSGDEWWATNGVDDIIRWDGTSDQVEVMSALGFKAKVLGVYANMMIFANLIQAGISKPADIINSNPGTPDDVSGGISGQFKVHGNFGEIYNLTPVGDALAIYSRYTVTVTQVTGNDTVFAFRQVISNQGAAGFKAVADFGDYHQFVGSDGLYAFDGVQVRDIGEHVWRNVIAGIKPQNRPFIYNIFNDVFGELIWVVPLTTDPTDSPQIAYTEHYLEETGLSDKKLPFSKREFPFTSAGTFTRQQTLTWDQIADTWQDMNFRWNDQFFSVAFPFILVGDEDGKVYTLNTTQSKDGVGMDSFVKFGRRPMWDGRIRGLLTRVFPYAVSGTTNLDVTIHMADAGEHAAVIDDTKTFDATSLTQHYTAHYRRGRFYAIEFGSDGDPWEISGYDIDKKPGGSR